MFNTKNLFNDEGEQYADQILQTLREALALAQSLKDGWMLLPEDYKTHHGDWFQACRAAYLQPNLDEDTKAYWVYQMKTLNDIEAMISAAPHTGGKE